MIFNVQSPNRAAVKHLVLEQGGDFELTRQLLLDAGIPFIWPPGSLFRLWVKSGPDSNVLLYEATTENELITYDPETGKITVSFPHEWTSTVRFRVALYDLFVYYAPRNSWTKLLKGNIRVNRSITEIDNVDPDPVFPPNIDGGAPDTEFEPGQEIDGGAPNTEFEPGQEVDGGDQSNTPGEVVLDGGGPGDSGDEITDGGSP